MKPLNLSAANPHRLCWHHIPSCIAPNGLPRHPPQPPPKRTAAVPLMPTRPRCCAGELRCLVLAESVGQRSTETGRLSLAVTARFGSAADAFNATPERQFLTSLGLIVASVVSIRSSQKTLGGWRCDCGPQSMRLASSQSQELRRCCRAGIDGSCVWSERAACAETLA